MLTEAAVKNIKRKRARKEVHCFP